MAPTARALCLPISHQGVFADISLVSGCVWQSCDNNGPGTGQVLGSSLSIMFNLPVWSALASPVPGIPMHAQVKEETPLGTLQL